VSERLEELAPFPDHSAELAALVGKPAGEPQIAPHAVNGPMIGHWVEAMGDANPVYVSDVAAQAYGFERVIAPPTMLQAWIMPGLRATQQREAARTAGDTDESTADVSDPAELTMKLLNAEGLTSVVATNCEQHYGRPLVLGDRVFVRSTIESVSDPKRTGLGTGRFVTTRMEFSAHSDLEVPAAPTPAEVAALAASGEPVATMRFRILKFLPPVPGVAPTGAEAAPEGEAPVRPRRPRPAVTQDNAFWFEGARAHQLLIQRCASCATLRHPPLPACAVCQSLEWDAVQASGRGVLYSFVVVHYPQVAAFDYPLPIGLVELEEGTRVVANLDGFAPGEPKIGQALQVTFVDYDDELSLPVFVAAPPDDTLHGGAS
jgi:uncharacterized OB-fold protein/acyl dehydratase